MAMVSKRTVVVHLGPPKTGSTSIQKRLASDRLELLDQGIHVQQSLNFLELVEYLRSDRLSEPVSDYLQALRLDLARHVLSCEFFSALTLAQWRRLVDDSQRQHGGELDWRLVAYVRHPMKVLLSGRQEMLKKGYTLQELRSGTLSMQYRNLYQRLDQAGLLACTDWRVFREGPEFDVVSDFYAAAALPPLPHGAAKVRLNRSMSLAAAQWLDQRNRSQPVRRAVSQGELARALEMDAEPFRLDEDELDLVRPLVSRELAWIQANLGIDLTGEA